MSESVAIIGGGVAGLTAAHELVNRGFTVHVYERRSIFGGKAASYRVPKPGQMNVTLDDPPGEHGFRFFPGWYQHLFATLRDIPYRDKATLYQGATVADNLVDVRTNRLAWLGRPPIDLPLQVPRNATEALTATQFVAAFRELGLSAGEVTLFFRKLLEVAAMPEATRVDKLEKISWWVFLECDDPARSQAYKDFIRATTRTMVAAKAEEASAYTIGRVAVRTFLDTLSSVDRVLNGPTNDVWIAPWIDHLQRKGVVFHPDMELEAIRFDAGSKRVRQLVVEPVVVADARRLRGLFARWMRTPADIDEQSLNDMLSLLRELSNVERLEVVVSPDSAARLVRLFQEAHQQLQVVVEQVVPLRQGLRLSQERLAKSRGPGAGGREKRAGLQREVEEIQRLLVKPHEQLATILEGMGELQETLGLFEAAGRRERPVEADHFVLALPLEQLAYHVNRSQMLTFLAPDLRKVLRLALHMDWMSGVQFYLNCRVSFSPGHLVGMDSPWALTAIESTRFWKDVTLPEGVKSILSVDISAWDQRGLRTRKEAFNCTDDEIANEVWYQMEQMLNRSEQPDVLRRDMLVDGELIRNLSYHLDESVVDLRDRKKQAFYERARGVRFDTVELVQQGERPEAEQPEDRYMWGPRLRFNTEPLLVNRPGSHALRPEVTTGIANLFLAGDYIKTETDLASMEGANESGRRAVNAILAATGSRKAPCDLFPFSPSRQVMGAVMSLGGALRGLEGAAGAASELQNRFWKRLALGVMRAQGNRELLG